jgi:hypothetical protein
MMGGAITQLRTGGSHRAYAVWFKIRVAYKTIWHGSPHEAFGSVPKQYQKQVAVMIFVTDGDGPMPDTTIHHMNQAPENSVRSGCAIKKS